MITIICGIPGAGKTCKLTHFIVQRMLENGLEDYLNLKREINQLSKGGFSNLELPPERHLCYADYTVRVNNRLKAYYGRVVKLKWTAREFFSCDTAESYMLAREKKENVDIGKVVEYETDLPIFNYYDSKGCRPAFYAGKYNQGFDYFTEDGYQFTLESYVEFNNKHYFVAPRGYYKNTEYDKQILKNIGAVV